MSSEQSETSSNTKRCFVVMGFGKKTDFATGRTLDLDKSYQYLIKPVVEKKRLQCIRADEILHSGTVDVTMYRELLTADVVIADLSTANPNALYELGIRHAMRPWTTIVISEDKLPYPFNLNHVKITGYTHLGEGIDYIEVKRFRKILSRTLDVVLRSPKTDSPVYTFLTKLTPPSLGEQAAKAVAKANQAVEHAVNSIAEAAADTQALEPGLDDKTLAELIEHGEQAIKDGRFYDAKTFFRSALQACEDGHRAHPSIHDPYLLHRLVFTTFKAKQPDDISALNEAIHMLESRLHLDESNDPETVGLAGAIEKRLFDKGQGVEHLTRAIGFCARGYFLRGDRYNGINLAYLLNVRTDTSLDATKEDRIADLVWANRIRREVLELCKQELKEIRGREKQRREERAVPETAQIKEEQEARDREQKFWCLTTKAEAHLGLGELGDYERAWSEAESVKTPAWMMQPRERQVGKLRGLLEKHGHLLNPPWPVGIGRVAQSSAGRPRIKTPPPVRHNPRKRT